MTDYTPTTGHILEAFAWDERYDGLDTEKMKQFDRWLAEEIRRAKEEAWEEGLEAKFKLLEGQESVSLDNPYRQGETE